MKKIVFLLCIKLLLMSCNRTSEKLVIQEKKYVTENNDVIKTNYYTQRSIDSMQKEVIGKGDKNSFIELVDYYFTGDGSYKKRDFLNICKLMSDKYQDKNASFYIYKILLSSEKCNKKSQLECLSKEDRKEALFYLNKASSLGQEGAILELKNVLRQE